MKKTAFILEDEFTHMQVIENALKDLHFEVIKATDSESAYAAAEDFKKNGKYPHLYIFDYKISKEHPKITGLDIASKILKLHKAAAIIMTGHKGDGEIDFKEIKNLGIPAKYFLSKDALADLNAFQEIISDAMSEFNFEVQSQSGLLGNIIKKFGFRVDSDDEDGRTEYFFKPFELISYLESGNGSTCLLHFTDGSKQFFGTNIGKIAFQISMYYLPFVYLDESLYVNINSVISLKIGNGSCDLVVEPNRVINLGTTAQTNIKKKLWIIKTDPRRKSR